MRDLVGTPRQPGNVQVAWRTCWEGISRQMTGPGGHFDSIPADYDAMMVFTSEVEGRECPYTPTGNGLANLFMDQFNDRFLPKSLHPVGRHFVPPVVRRGYDLRESNKVISFFARRAFRLMFHLLDPRAPDNSVRNSEKHSPFT